MHTGGGSAAVCVRFDEAAISGLDALQRAGLGAVIRGFSGQGGAVCGINGVGCPADDSCLTCQAPNYWAYHRAGPGAGGFSYASVGAGSTQVTDGSVEGWQWGTGAPPPFQTVDQVCGAATPSPPPAPAPNPAPATGGAVGAGPGGSSSGGGDQGSPGVAAESAAATSEPVATTTTAAPTTTVLSRAEAAEDGTADGQERRTLDGELAASQRGRGRRWQLDPGHCALRPARGGCRRGGRRHPAAPRRLSTVPTTGAEMA